MSTCLYVHTAGFFHLLTRTTRSLTPLKKQTDYILIVSLVSIINLFTFVVFDHYDQPLFLFRRQCVLAVASSSAACARPLRPAFAFLLAAAYTVVVVTSTSTTSTTACLLVL